VEVAGAVAGGDVVGDFLVEGDQADGVALHGEEVGERGGAGAGVFDLGVLQRAVAHGATQVDQEVAAEVGFFLEALDVVPVGAGVEAPVEVAGVVAGDVLAVLAEFDGEAVVGAAVEAGKEALDDDAGAELEALDPHEGLRVNEGGAAGGARVAAGRGGLGGGVSDD
jgi:hypothetical protein